MPVIADHCVIYARFRLRPGARDTYLALLETVLKGIEGDPWCKTIIVQADEQDPDTIILYEIWAGTRADFERRELGKPYRAEYMRVLPTLLREPVHVEWWAPISEWCSDLTGVVPAIGDAA